MTSYPNQVNLVIGGTVAESGTGTSWQTPLSHCIDGDFSTDVRPTGTLGVGAYSKVLKITNFDFSWFDNTLYDVTGVNIVLVQAGTTTQAIQFSEAYLVDENGNDLGSNMGGTSGEWLVNEAAAVQPVLGYASGKSVSTETIIDIPYSTYSSSNFGVRFKLYNGGTGVALSIIYSVYMVLQFKRKITTADYGFEVFNSGGTSKVTQTSSFVKYVEGVSHVGGYTGTDTLSNWSDERGVPLIYSHWEKWNTSANTQATKGQAWTTANLGMRGHGMEMPTISYVTATKVVTYATGVSRVGWDEWGTPSCGWSLSFVHYK